ncbi:MAG: FAD:protein FMN transferase [Lachnospiraceae bacterium]|nr:FAD:protein FMN transferase [Lachnospiraceae bacterium]
MKYIRKKRGRLLPVLLSLTICGVGLTGCGMRENRAHEETDVYGKTGIAMGTVVTQTLYIGGESDAQDAKEISDEIWQLLSDTEQELSWRIEDSWVERINRSAGADEGCVLDEDFAAALGTLWEVSAASDGALDLTIAPVVRLWNIDEWAVSGEGKLPEEKQIADALMRTGYEQVILEENRIRLPEGFCMELGAVGKGMACDRILELMKGRPEVEAAVFSLGGNILTYGEKPDGTAWRVGIVDPAAKDSFLGVLELSGTYVVTTSGDYERYVEVDGVRYHHIIDPDTGYPAASGIRGVTILSESGMLGDALSTACFVLGPEKAMKLAAEYEVEILIVTTEEEILMSEGMRKVYSPAK